MMAGTLLGSRNQVVPGTSYGIMTGKKEKEHLESPGDTFNLAVLPEALFPFFLLLLALPLFPHGLWSLVIDLSENYGHCFPE